MRARTAFPWDDGIRRRAGRALVRVADLERIRLGGLVLDRKSCDVCVRLPGVGTWPLS
jgi:hypothetical protein